MPLIKLENIHFSYSEGDSNGNFSLLDINFSIEKGEFISILGPNGSGKSTLLKIMSGYLRAQKGNISIEEIPFQRFTHKQLAKRIAFVPQTTHSIFPFSVYEIVMMGRTPYLNLAGFEKSEDRKIVDDALERVGISHLKKKGINEISGGEAQRAFIARALVQRPEIILLDEPNAHLDIKHQISVFNLLKSLNEEQKMTVIAVSHDLNLAGHYSYRAILLDNGRIYLDDEKKNVLTENNIKNVFKVNSKVMLDSKLNSVSITIKPQSQ